MASLETSESSDFWAPVEPQAQNKKGDAGLAILDDDEDDLLGTPSPAKAVAASPPQPPSAKNILDSDDSDDMLMRVAHSTTNMKAGLGALDEPAPQQQQQKQPKDALELEPAGSGAGERQPLRHTPLRSAVRSLPSQPTSEAGSSQQVLSHVSGLGPSSSAAAAGATNSDLRETVSFGDLRLDPAAVATPTPAPAMAAAASVLSPTVVINSTKAANDNNAGFAPVVAPGGGLQHAGLYDEALGFPCPKGYAQSAEFKSREIEYDPFFGPPVRKSSGLRKPTGPPKSAASALKPPQQQQQIGMQQQQQQSLIQNQHHQHHQMMMMQQQRQQHHHHHHHHQHAAQHQHHQQFQQQQMMMMQQQQQQQMMMQQQQQRGQQQQHHHHHHQHRGGMAPQQAALLQQMGIRAPQQPPQPVYTGAPISPSHAQQQQQQQRGGGGNVGAASREPIAGGSNKAPSAAPAPATSSIHMDDL